MKNENEFVTITLQGWINGGMNVSQIIIGLHNAFNHGIILEENGLDVTDENLSTLFEGLDLMETAIKAMQ